MTTIHVDAEQSAGAGNVIADPDTSGYHITIPDATIEVSGAQLLGIIQAGGALLGVGAKPVRLAVIGDSNTVIRPGVTLAQTLPYVLGAAVGASEVGVFAFGGENSSHGVGRLPAVEAFKPTHIIIAHGVNDADAPQGITPDAYIINMTKMIKAGFGMLAKVIVVSPIFVAASPILEAQRDYYMPAWKKLGAIDGVKMVDVYSSMAAMITQDANRTRFDAIYNSGDTSHYGASGIVWLAGRIKDVWS